jgi:hypothetical protein
MKHRTRFSIALLITIVLLSLTSSVNAQQVRRHVADTGIITLGPNQKLRVAIAGDFDGDADVDGTDFLFKRFGYIEQDNIYRVASQTTDTINLVQNEGASIDINQGGFRAVRCVVSGNLSVKDAKSARVTVQIINKITNQVESVLVALLIP